MATEKETTERLSALRARLMSAIQEASDIRIALARFTEEVSPDDACGQSDLWRHLATARGWAREAEENARNAFDATSKAVASLR